MTKPPYDLNLKSISNKHKHIWWDFQGKKKKSECNCDTGHDHTTPREKSVQ
jgi:hypothetical protein